LKIGQPGKGVETMLRLGAHESIGGGLYRALERGEAAGCQSLQIWTKNSRQWTTPPLDTAEIEQFQAARSQRDIHPIVAHASYLINIASPKPALYARSVKALIDEAERCEQLGLPYLVLHPGAHTGDGMDAGLQRAQAALRDVLTALPGYRVRILLETTAGSGSALGSTFEELAALLEADTDSTGLGVCLDTCHVFAAGYDLRSEQAYETMMRALDETVGLNALHVVHLNDSRHPLGSRKDRHEHIGKGHLGVAGFQHILTDPRLEGIAGILETPKSEDLHEDRDNLARLRAIAAGTPVEEIVSNEDHDGASE
jgi:deoxyribonuclease-4